MEIMILGSVGSLRKDSYNRSARKAAQEPVEDLSTEGEQIMNEAIPSRRVMLRGALAVGCGLCLPIALSACDPKKGETSTGAAPAGPQTTPAASAAPAAAKKVPQSSVQYQGQPKGEQKCGGCANFIAESKTCKLVEGQISPDGWCSIWTKKA